MAKIISLIDQEDKVIHLFLHSNDVLMGKDYKVGQLNLTNQRTKYYIEDKSENFYK